MSCLREMFRIRWLWSPLRIVTTFVVLLVLSRAKGHTEESCLEHFTCHWEGDVFVLQCESINKTMASQLMIATIKDLLVSTTRLKIVCDRKQRGMKVTFSNLFDLRELTLDGIDVTANGSNIFHGVSNISHLVLRNLYWKSIDTDCFKDLSKLLSLTLDHLDRLIYVDPDALTPLVSLKYLSFLYIALPYNEYIPVLKGMESVHFQKLSLHGIKSPDIGVEINFLFGNWSQRAILKSLDLQNNKYNTISLMGIDLFMPALEHVNMVGNLAASIPFESPASLSYIFSNTNLKTVSVTGMKRSPAKLSLKSLCAISVSTNVSSLYHPNWPLPPVDVGWQLETISFNGAVFLTENVILPQVIFDYEFPKGGYGIQINGSSSVLKYIDISNMLSSACITIAFVGFHAVEYFNMQNVRSIDTAVFKEMFNVTVLLLGNNDLGYAVANDREHILFGENKKLKVLDLSGCHLTKIPSDEFLHLQDLQQLNLSLNALEEFPVELYTFNEFRFLNLSYNKLSILPASTCAQLDQMAANRTVYVDISHNPLKCTCNDTNFVLWIRKTHVNFKNKLNTFCEDTNNKLRFVFRLDIDEFERTCYTDRYTKETTGPSVTTGPSNTKPPIDNHGNNLYVKTVLPATVALVLISVLLCVTYRYRWKCAYALNRLKKYSMFTDVQLEERDYERDAFICYNSNDSGWVCHDLLDHLDSSGISTIIHHRDFLPGSVLGETIRESIDKCRFTVLVLSPDFLASNWCRLEMHVARNLIISEGRDVIVPIILHELPASLVTRTLEGILTKSYIQWTDNPEGQALFWDKLITKLKRGGNLRPLEN